MKTNTSHLKQSLLAVFFLAFTVQNALASQVLLFKYTNVQGNTVIDQRIPPEYVRHGYTILNQRGMVIEVVARAPTQAELDAKVRSAERVKEQQAQVESNELLLLAYGSTKDATRIKNDKISAIVRSIGIMQSNLKELKIQSRALVARAAYYERSGRAVEDSHQKKIDSLASRYNELNGQIKLKMSQKTSVERDYQNIQDKLESLATTNSMAAIGEFDDNFMDAH